MNNQNQTLNKVVKISFLVIALVLVLSAAYVYTADKKVYSDLSTDQSSAVETPGGDFSEYRPDSSLDQDVSVNSLINARATSVTDSNSVISVNSVEYQSQNSTPDPWILIDIMKMYVQEQNQEKLNSALFKPLPSCKTKSECDFMFQILDALLGSFNKKDYINIWEDDKQIILSTNIEKKNTSEEKAYLRNYIFFAKDSALGVKFVGSSMKNLSYIKRYVSLTDAQMTAELEAFIADTDMDGLTDQEERCAGNAAPKDCVKTNPTNRDSDGDGWWDGLQAKF